MGMGEFADMVLEGLIDEETGEYIGDANEEIYGTAAPGFPISHQRNAREQSQESSKQRFKPTKESLFDLSLSLRVEDVEALMLHVVKRVSHDYCTKYELFINCEGAHSSFTTTGPDYLKATGTSMRNLRGDFINEGMK